MPEMTTISTEELTDLRARVKKLATDKSYLQLIIRLMNRVNAVPGLDHTIESMLKNIVDVIGGTNIILYYVIDGDVHYADVYGDRRKLEGVADSLVQKVMETHEPIEFEHEFSDSGMMTTEFSKAYTWIVPLLVGEDLVGVFKMESLNIAMRDLYQHLPAFFAYTALILKNEILGHTRLKQAYDRIEQEMVVRQRVEEELRRANETLEERVSERTAELQKANEQLSGNERQIKSLLDKSEQSRRALLSIIEDEKQVEMTLWRERALLKRIMETSPVGITMINRDGQVTFANPQAEKVLGLSKGEITQRAYNAPEWRITDYEGNAIPNEQLPFLRVMSTGQPVRDAQHAIVWPDGRRVFLSINGAPLLNETGEVESVVCTIEDVTEHKQAEMALQRLNRELRAISNCNQALLRAVDEQTLLDDICRIICDEAGYRMAWVGYPQHDQVLGGRPVVWAGVEEGYLAAADIITRSTPKRELGSNEIVIWNGVTTYIYDFATDPEAAPWREVALQRGYRSKVGLPLKDEDANTFGVLHIYSAEPNAFTSDEIRLLEELAGDLAFGITALRTRAERKQAEEALRESEYKLGEAARIAHVGYWDRDYVAETINLSDEACQIFGLPLQNRFLKLSEWHTQWLKLIHPEDQPGVMQVLTDALAGGPPYNVDYRVIRPDGDIRHIHSYAKLTRDESGKPIRMFGTMIDITERKQAEEALRESETRFRAVFENSVDAIGVSKAGIHVFVNPAYLALFGYADNAELTGRPILDLIAPSQHKHILENVRRRADGHSAPAAYETRGLRKDGSEFDMDTHVSTYELDDEVYTVAHLRDITERKQAEKALRESEERLRQIASSLREVIWLRDAQTRQVLYVNPAFQELTGRTCESFYENRDVAMDAVHPDDKKEVLKALAQRSGNAYYDKEHRIIHLDGSVHWVSSRSFPVRNEAGEVYRWATIMEDITERKQAVDALHERERHSQSLLRLSRNLERAQTYTEVLDAARDEVKSIVGYQNLWAYLFAEDKRHAHAIFAGGPLEKVVMSEDGTATLTVQGDRMLEEIVEAKEIVVVEDAQADDRVNREIVEMLGNRTIVNVPIVLFDRHLGSVGMGTFGDEGVRIPTASEREYLVALASHMAVTLDRIHLLDTRRQAEQSLRENEEKFRTLVEQSAEGVMLADEDGNIVEWNHAYERITGLEQSRVLGKPVWDMMTKIIAPERATTERYESIKAGILESLRTGKSPLFAAPTELEFHPISSREKHYLHQTIFPIKTERGYRIASLVEDITEHKHAEENLRQMNERFSLAARAAHLGVWDWDIQKDELVWDDGMYALYGVKREDFAGAYDAWLKGVHPDDRAPSDEISQQARRGEREYDTEFRVIWPDGNIHHLTASGQVVRDADGKPLRMTGINFDITERKQMIEALAAQEREFRTLAENSPDNIARYDVNCRTLYINPALERTLGRTASELLGTTPTEVAIIDENKRYQEKISEVIESGKDDEMDLVLPDKEGGVRYHNVRFVAERGADGVVTGVQTIGRDVTERKSAEVAMLRRSRQLEILSNASQQINIVLEIPAVLRQLIAAALELIGASDGTAGLMLDGKLVFKEYNLYGQLMPIDYQFVEGYGVPGWVMQTRAPYVSNDAEHDPHVIPEIQKALGFRNLADVPIFNRQGELLGCFEIHNKPGGFDNTDVLMLQGLAASAAIALENTAMLTERKQAEEEILRLNQNLEQRVIDRTSQLEAANKELEAFAYSVSHDLRAPLRHIDGFIDMLRDRMGASLDDQSLHYMDVIADAARKMGALIDDLLSFSRMGRNEMSKAQVDLDELVQEVIREFRYETEGRYIQWKVSSLPVVNGDHAMLRMVMTNLISNALKFTRSRTPAQIEIGCERKDEAEAVIFIRDNGVGFDMTYTDKLFGVFQRLHHQKDFEGTGIGLANVRRIISRHGGRTWAVGEVDHGATFYFSLPQSFQGQSSAKEAKIRSNGKLKGAE